MIARPDAKPVPTFAGRAYSAHDPEKPVLDMIGDGNRFSDKIMRNKNVLRCEQRG
jgi:hypothetical protein